MEQYFVSYTIVPTTSPGWRRDQIKQYAVFSTDDLATIVTQIIPTRRRTGRGKLKSQLKEYAEHGRVTFGSSGNSGVIKDIVITRLPPRDMKVLDKYL